VDFHDVRWLSVEVIAASPQPLERDPACLLVTQEGFSEERIAPETEAMPAAHDSNALFKVGAELVQSASLPFPEPFLAVARDPSQLADRVALSE